MSWRCAYWPDWSPDQAERRVEAMAEAWNAIKGMLKDHPLLPEFQDPILLAVSRDQLEFSRHVNPGEMVQDVAAEWDKYIDTQHMVRNTFNARLQMTLTSDLGSIATTAVEAGNIYGDFMVTSTFEAPNNGPTVDEEMVEAHPDLKKEGRGEKRLVRRDENNSDGVCSKRRKAQHKPSVEGDAEDIALFAELPIDAELESSAGSRKSRSFGFASMLHAGRIK